MFRQMHIDDMTQTEYEATYALMTAEKKARVDRFRFERDKRLTVCGELLARRMLAAYCGVMPEDIVLLTGAHGKPYAAGLEVQFNISHSGEMVLCAVSDTPIGADIEQMRTADEKLIRFVCTDEEKAYVLDAADDADKQRRFFRIWTAKEAYFKCLGTGITDFKSLCVLDEAFQAKLQSFYQDDYAISIYQK